jgi:hypothetical protein
VWKCTASWSIAIPQMTHNELLLASCNKCWSKAYSHVTRSPANYVRHLERALFCMCVCVCVCVCVRVCVCVHKGFQITLYNSSEKTVTNIAVSAAATATASYYLLPAFEQYITKVFINYYWTCL